MLYRNVVLTLLMVAMTVVAIELARRPVAPRPSPAGDPIFEANSRLLQKRIPYLDLRGLTVGQSIERIRQETGVPMAVNWTGLDKLRDRPVDSELHDIALGDAVEFVLCLDQYAGRYYPIQQAEFDVADGTLMIGASGHVGSRDNFPGRSMRLRVYEVRDLLTDSYWGFEAPNKVAEEDRRLGLLAELIQWNMELKNWPTGPGSHAIGTEAEGTASAVTWAGHILVVQTTQGHMRIEAFLDQLRSMGKDRK